MIRFGREITGDLNAALRREWLVTNGIGGYAMGTPLMTRTRRYHGILVAATQPPAVRHLMTAALDTWVEIGGTRHPLCAHEWAGGVILPDGYRNLERFQLDGAIPTWTWVINDVSIVQRLWMHPASSSQYPYNTTYVTYDYVRGEGAVNLQITPLCTYRDHHEDTRGGGDIQIEIKERDHWLQAAILTTRDLSRADQDFTPLPYYLYADADQIDSLQEWWWSFHLAQETERGLTDSEDLFAAVTFRRTLHPGETLTFVCSTDEHAPMDPVQSLELVRRRQQELLERAELDDAPLWVNQLVFAANQFIVERQIEGQVGSTVIAGYPWFSDWGRDTMIALPGLTLATRRPEITAQVLRTFAHFVDQGMLPNRFPDTGSAPEYNTADATLWYFEAIRAYLSLVDDPELGAELYPILKDIIEWHEKGTRYGIHVDPADGLLHIGEEGVQLTWMDVKIDDWVVTPRTGKPVEINALWYSALTMIAGLANRLGHKTDAARYLKMAARVHASFNARFWHSGGYLYDVIDTPEKTDDASLRPNQLLAVALREDLLDDPKARAVVDICARQLVTSNGLRSLAPDEPDYTGHYLGDLKARDSAYHQGTVWSWLIGVFVGAHYRVYRDPQAALSYLEPLGDHLNDAVLGSISEIFDGDAPHTPRGAAAQAWSVAEVLRAYRLIEPGLDQT